MNDQQVNSRFLFLEKRIGDTNDLMLELRDRVDLNDHDIFELFRIYNSVTDDIEQINNKLTVIDQALGRFKL